VQSLLASPAVGQVIATGRYGVLYCSTEIQSIRQFKLNAKCQLGLISEFLPAQLFQIRNIAFQHLPRYEDAHTKTDERVGVEFAVLIAVAMKRYPLLAYSACSPYVKRRFGRNYQSYLQGKNKPSEK
jgi:hypothetical protein